MNQSEALAPGGWLAGIRRRPSPHADLRPFGTQVELIVLHGVSLPRGEFGGRCVEDFFAGCLDFSWYPSLRELENLKVSPHLYIDRTGEVVQMVSLAHRAWHAGVSKWRGRTCCNDFSIGIELEGTDMLPYTDAQYAALGWLIPVLRRAFPLIAEDAVVGHSDIAPGRKTDPGPSFDWRRLRAAMVATRYNLKRGEMEEAAGK